MLEQTLDTSMDLSPLLEMMQSGLPMDFSSFSDEEYLRIMESFSIFNSRVFEGVERELNERQRGVMHCAKCGKLELVKDPGHSPLDHWKPIHIYMSCYMHICKIS